MLTAVWQVSDLWDVDLAFVHELDDDGQVGVAGLAHDDDRVRFRMFQKQLLEVRAARRQHHLADRNCFDDSIKNQFVSTQSNSVRIMKKLIWILF